MKRNSISCALLISLLGIAAMGCDDKKSEVTSSVPAPKPSSGNPANSPKVTPAIKPAAVVKDEKPESVDTELVISEKMKTYIHCYNDIDASVYSSIERYASWLEDFEKGPTGKERVIYGLYSVSDISECKKDIAEAAQLQPPLEPIDTIAVKYIKAADDIITLINPLERYYDQEDYKDDAFKKAKESHLPLVTAWKTFKPVSAEYQDAIETINNERQVASLKEMEKKEGKTIHYYTLSTMINSKVLNKMLRQDAFPADQAMNLVTDLQASIDMINQLDGKTDNMSIDYDGFARDGEDYVLAAKQRIRRVRDKIPYSEFDQNSMKNSIFAESVEGSFEKVIAAYNTMVADFNRMQRR